ncbi:NAD(P)/FAD-dependent oxidoreductase [candidate division KSB1 bacterium]|nr:NAD(P)/FAD-dependent oxidoreductase [candidate division KSB1 bacterium]
MPEKIPITIIGAGVIGCAVAAQLSKKYDEIIVFEKNPKVTAENQSSRNSGVVHAGIYYPNDVSPLKADLCVRGNKMLYDFCQEFNIPHAQTGKLVVAVQDWELPYLEDALRIALDNKLPGAKLISSDEAKKMEPNIECIKAAYFPTSGIVEATQLVHRLYTHATQNNTCFLSGSKIINVKPKGRIFELTTETNGQVEIFESEIVINCAGLYSDEIARMVDPDCPFEILPIRGEATKFYKNKRSEIDHRGMNVYPVPTPIDSAGKKIKIPFEEFQKLFKQNKVLKTVGIHLTPTFDTIDGEYQIGDTVTIGPASQKAGNKEDYSNDLFQPGYYLENIKQFFPNLKLDDISLHQAGIQAKLSDRFDWVIEPDEKYPNFIQLIGIDSPGLTSCLAIAEYVEELVKIL